MGFPAEVVAATIPGMDDTLFTLPPTEPALSEKLAPGELRSVDLDGLLPADHRARLVWAFVKGPDLGPLYARIKAVEGHPGRPPIDPAILTALWLYATLEGVGSARALDRLCASHDAYRWLAGGVGLEHGEGDQLLVAVGERLRCVVRAADTIARMGGDEFAILVEDPPDSLVPHDVASRLLASLTRPFALGGKELYVRASIGIATAQSRLQTAEELIRNADLSMYTA
jgi:hypothetical protein